MADKQPKAKKQKISSKQLDDLKRLEAMVEEKTLPPPPKLGVLSQREPELELGDRLQRAREAKGFTQGELAELTKRPDKDGKGLSRAVISLYEAGTNRPGPREIRLLCEALRVTPSYFIYGADDPFDTFLDRHRYGVIGGSDPEVVAAITYCFKSLKPHHRIAIMELMLGMLRGSNKGFDEELDRKANSTFIEIADDLKLIMAERQKPQGEK